MATSATDSETVVRAWFTALNDRDFDNGLMLWAPGGVEKVHGDRELVAPEGQRAFFGEMFGAFPDARFEEVSLTSEGERCVLAWRLSGTFAGPGALNGIEPTGAEVELEGVDIFTVRDGLIHRMDAYTNQLHLARQIGLVPPADSAGERRLNALFNGRTKALGKLAGAGATPIGEGVWVISAGGLQKAFNVWLIADGDGVLAIDFAIKQIRGTITAEAAQRGGLTRIVLSHAHYDHRGGAALAGVPVLCGEAEKASAEADGGQDYFTPQDFPPPVRWLAPRLGPLGDAGPVTIAETLREGDEVAAGFKVVETPGHAPGHISFFRESDRLLLAADAFFGLDVITGRQVEPRIGPKAFNWDDDVARASLRKLADLEPATAWPSHGEPVSGDVGAKLRRGA